MQDGKVWSDFEFETGSMYCVKFNAAGEVNVKKCYVNDGTTTSPVTTPNTDACGPDNDPCSGGDCTVNGGFAECSNCPIGFAGKFCNTSVGGCSSGAASLSEGEQTFIDCTGCPKGGLNGGGWGWLNVYGSGIYTNDSAVCKAAAHEGRTGVLTVEGVAAQSGYIGATQNEITTESYVSYWPHGSFQFV